MPVWPLLTRYAAPLAVIWGVGCIFLANVPVVDLTLPGFVAKSLFSLFGVVLLAANWRRILANLDGGEVLGIAFFAALCIIASFVSIARGEPFSMYRLVKVLVLNVDIFLVAKLLDSRVAIERYVRAFALVCLLASTQAIVAVVAEFAGVRRAFMLGTVNESGVLTGSFDYAWFGLLGRVNSDIRTMFYFDEPAYFGQMLAVGLVMMVAMRRLAGIAVIGLGLLTSWAVAAWGGTALALVVIMVRFRQLREMLVIGALIAIGVLLLLPMVERLGTGVVFSLMDKFAAGASGTDKANAFFHLMDYLRNSPFGAGLVDLEAEFNAYFNSSPSPVQLALYFGILSLPCLAMLCLPVVWQGLIRPAGRYGGVLWIGLGGAMVATLTAGPLLKYWMVFLFSALLTLRRVELGEREAAFVKAAPRFDGGLALPSA